MWKKLKGVKVLSMVLVAVMIFGLAGCGTQTTEAPAPAPAEDSNVVADAVNAYFANIPDNNRKIKQADFVEKVKAGEDMFVLDIRQPDVYGEGHIKGAVNAPWGTAISENLDKLPTDKTIMVYCYSGQTAGQAVATLNMAGFDARSVNLGWNLGISKVEGLEDVLETTPNNFGEAKTEIAPEIQAALDEYYAGLADVKDTTFKNYKIGEAKLKELIDAKDDSIVILSIRSAEDFAKGHIEGAINIPWGSGMEQKFDTLPTDKKVVVYCYTGQTAGQTVAGLKLLGYDAVSLNGGMGMEANAPKGWTNQGLEVVQ